MIDYSQFSLYNFCPWAWYERYVNQRQLRRVGQRSDPLCLGSLTHNGLDNFSKLGKPIIDEETIIENEPTRETLDLAQRLVQGYIRKYGVEPWPVERTEQPLRFPLADQIDDAWPLPFDGLAKLDGYFYVPSDTTIESGLPGETLTLARGWWSREYKTKSYSRKRSEWIKEWQTKRQADFQMLALQHLLKQQMDRYEFYNGFRPPEVVQGVLVCVLEKPYEHIPERKCKGCANTYPLATFDVTPEGYRCPVCRAVQTLKPYIAKSSHEPEYFRIIITRTPEQLEIARAEILSTALDMERVRQNGMHTARPNRDACVNNVHRHECEYWEPHTYGGTTSDGFKYVKIDATKYMGLPA